MKNIMDTINKRSILEVKIGHDIYQAYQENRECVEDLINHNLGIVPEGIELHTTACLVAGVDMCVCLAAKGDTGQLMTSKIL